MKTIALLCFMALTGCSDPAPVQNWCIEADVRDKILTSAIINGLGTGTIRKRHEEWVEAAGMCELQARARSTQQLERAL